MSRSKTAPPQTRPADDARLATVVARVKSPAHPDIITDTPRRSRHANSLDAALPIASRLPVGFKRPSASSTRRERRAEMSPPFLACLVPWNVPVADLTREERKRWKR